MPIACLFLINVIFCWSSFKHNINELLCWKQLGKDDNFSYEYNSVTNKRRTVRLRPIRGGYQPKPSSDWVYDKDMNPTLPPPTLPTK